MTQTDTKDNTDAIRWVYEKDNKWVDYDDATTAQLEDNFQKGLKTKKKLKLIVKLKHGKFSSPDLKEKYIVNIQLDASAKPPVIWKSVQTFKQNKKYMLNVTRFPCFDTDNSQQEITEIKDYKCQYKWYWKDDDDDKLNDGDDDDNNGTDGWSEYDAITSSQIEIALNKHKKFIILNKSNYFKSPKNKNLYRVTFNYHSDPTEATQIEYYSLQKSKKTEIMYEPINAITQKHSINPILDVIFLTKHYFRPLSMKYWSTKKLLFKDELQCHICFMEFEDNNFLEYHISRKLNDMINVTDVIDPQDIAIQLSLCLGEHFFHTGCVAQWFVRKKECPSCRIKYGVLSGHQPVGKMTVEIDKTRDCDGVANKKKGLIEIVHSFKGGVQGAYHQNPGERYAPDQRYIYLPNTSKGKEILELIKIGWKRKLLYTVGHSVTRGTNNSIIWNGVHFKTNRYGGTQNWGWPDKTYYARVKDEFKEKGITPADIPRKKKKKKATK